MNYSISKDSLQTGLLAGLMAHFGFDLQGKDQHQGLFSVPGIHPSVRSFKEVM